MGGGERLADGERPGGGLRMTPPAGALRVALRILADVKHDVVVPGGADAAGQRVEVQCVANLPRDDVVCDGGIATHTEVEE